MKTNRTTEGGMTRRKLVIDRKVWLRGEGGSASVLLRIDDGKMCCVGIYLRSLRVARKHLIEVGDADGLNCGLPASARWLSDSDVQRLYRDNDAMSLTEPDREGRVAAAFAEHGVDVEFVG